MLSINGKPYDTLDEVIGIAENPSSLKSFGVKYEQIDLINDDFDYEKMNEKSTEEVQQPEKIDHTHTGFENTRKMLQILYGENYKFNIWSEKGKGTKIDIILPAERGEIPCGK